MYIPLLLLRCDISRPLSCLSDMNPSKNSHITIVEVKLKKILYVRGSPVRYIGVMGWDVKGCYE